MTGPTTGPTTAPGGTRRSERRPSPGARRFGYVITIAINLAFLVLIHVEPGWQAADFLTSRTPEVLGWVTGSIVVGLVANLVWVVADPPWLRAFGDLVGAAVGVVASAVLLTVFPFTFDDGSLWPTVLRVVLWVGIVGGAIGVVAHLVALVRALARRTDA